MEDISLLFLFLSLPLSLSLKVVTYPIILGNIKTNCVITSYNYPNKYLKFLFVFTILMQLQVILRKLYNQHQHHKFILASLHHKIVLLLLLSYQISTLLHYRKILFIFLAKWSEHLSKKVLFVRKYYGNSDFDFY